MSKGKLNICLMVILLVVLTYGFYTITSINKMTAPPSYKVELITITADCENCFDRSFASHEKSKYWDNLLNDKDPRNVSLNSGKKYWFECDKCEHNWPES